MSDTTASILDRYAAIVADRDAQKQAEAAETARRAAAEQQMQFDRDTARLAEYFPPEIMALGWRYEPAERCGDSLHRNLYTLVSTFLPDDVEPLRLLVDYPHYRDHKHPDLRLHGYDHWHVSRGASKDEVDEVLAPIITSHVRRCRERAHEAEEARLARIEQAEREEARLAEQRRWQAEQEAHTARINAQADELRSQAEREIADELAQLTERFGWPSGATLTVYELIWIEGVDGEGTVQRSDPLWLADPDPDADGFYTALLDGGAYRVRVAGTAVVTRERTWRSADDLPPELRRTAYRARRIEIWDAEGTRRLFSTGEIHGESARLPEPSIRTLLGGDAGDLPIVKPTTIAVRETGDCFEPFVPPASESADAGDDLADLPF